MLREFWEFCGNSLGILQEFFENSAGILWEFCALGIFREILGEFLGFSFWNSLGILLEIFVDS